MIDYFALLDLERRPFIADDSLKNAYLRKSEMIREQTNDLDALSSVNMAFRTLSNPAARTQHLLNIEFGDARGGRLAPDIGAIFGPVAEAVQMADRELGSLSLQSSALVRAMAYRKVDGVRDKLAEVENELSKRESGLLSELQQLDAVWHEDPAQCRDRLAQIGLRLTFVQKWLSEVHERQIRFEELA
jgi:hypothetical protein